jgi:hypothetical protein
VGERLRLSELNDAPEQRAAFNRALEVDRGGQSSATCAT